MTPRDLGTKDRLIVANRNRRNIYAFLSRMYEKEISVDFLKELSSKESPIFQIRDSEGLNEGFSRGFGLMSGYLTLGGRNLNDVWLELAAEYASLFLGVKKKPAHPSESVYTSGGPYTFQESRDEVLKAYLQAGVDRVKEFKEPEDHIALELQFMEYLCRKTVEALEKNEKDEARKSLKLQKQFVDDHLAKWIPQFTQDILESADVDFYKGVAYVTRAFISSEKDAIADLIKDEELSD
jgi:putative dimethyl sulfoxide reductase chaperone